jgi:O-antigen/teichoic acid export membrane protein
LSPRSPPLFSSGLSLVGQYQLTLAWLFFIWAFSCFGGVTLITTRELSQGRKECSSIFSAAAVLQASICAPLFAACAILFAYLLSFRQIALPLTIGTAAMLAAMLLQLSQALLLSKGLIGKAVAASIIGHLGATLLVLLAANRGGSILALLCAWSAYHLLYGAVLFLQSRAWQAISPAMVKGETIKALVRETLPMLVMILATHLYVRIDVMMLDWFAGKQVVAQYGAGYLFLDQLMILSNFMMSALFPNFAKAAITCGAEFRLLYRGILTLFAKYLAPLALLIGVFSKDLLWGFFGAEYAAAWPSLSVLMLAAFFAWLNGPSGTIFISLKKPHIYMWAVILSLLVNVIGNFILIPRMGALGAAAATVLTELALCGFCLLWIYRETGYLPWMRCQA